MVSSVEFGVLGPLSAQVGGRPVPIGSPKHRAMLAVLLLNRGRPQSVGEMAYAIWGTRPPRNPRRAVHIHVSRLRALLGSGGSGRLIVTHADGYAIEAAADQLDLARFEYWYGQARRAAAAGDLEAESTALRRALDQWRGEPLTDVPSEALHLEVVPRLREQRLKALDRRIEVELRQGRHAELTAELSELTARHPFHERFWAHLMTALHVGGRRADALEAFHTVRRHLTTELGIEPGRELRALHAAILTDDDCTAFTCIQ